MKFILVISFLVSLLLSNETRLIIGCFKEPKNAENAKIKIDEYVQNDTKFKNFLQKNSVTTKYKVIGEWNVISFEPFNDNKVLYHTYFKIKEMYPDSYKIDMGAKGDQEIMASYSKAETPSAKDKIKEPSVSKTEKIMTFQDEMKQTSPAKDKVTKPINSEKVQKQETAKVTKNTLSSTKKSEESNSDVPYLYPLIVIVLIVVIFIIYFTQRKPKKTLHTLKDDFEEDLS